MNEVSVSAPATIANLGALYDIGGLAIQKLGDSVTAELVDKFDGVKIVDIQHGPNVDKGVTIPKDDTNLAVVVGNQIVESHKKEQKITKDIGIEIKLSKNMGVGTGLGSSAASIVASAVSIFQLLKIPIEDNSIFEYIVSTEATVSGTRHGDNVLPSLLGGFVFIEDLDNFGYKRFEAGDDLYFTIASPKNISLMTNDMRSVLESSPIKINQLVKVVAGVVKNYSESGREDLSLSDLSGQELYSLIKPGNRKAEGELIKKIETYLTGALMVYQGFKQKNTKLICKGIGCDEIIVPTRKEHIPGYSELENEALQNGALAYSISGSGPAVYAVSENRETAYNISEIFSRLTENIIFKNKPVDYMILVTQVRNDGALINLRT